MLKIWKKSNISKNGNILYSVMRRENSLLFLLTFIFVNINEKNELSL